MERNELLIELLKERIEEIKADIKEFSILEIKALDPKSKLRYGMMVAQYQDMLLSTCEGLEYAEEREKYLEGLDELLNSDLEEVDLEDLFKKVLRVLNK